MERPPQTEGKSWRSLLLLSTVSCLAGPALAQGMDRNLSRLGEIPDWNLLEPYQESMSREAFEAELLGNYTEEGADAAGLFEFGENEVTILQNTKRPDEVFILRFTPEPPPVPPRPWRSTAELRPYRNPDQPLEGLRIAIDPGHIGGDWARMEHRWFVIFPEGPGEGEGDSTTGPRFEAPIRANLPVREGNIVLRVAQLLEDRLTRLGARVILTRRTLEPVTTRRPDDFVSLAREIYRFPLDATMDNSTALRSSVERLFYVNSEIQARADLLNDRARPDLTLCLHVNAEAWGNPASPDFVDANHLHILINGCYGRAELINDDERFEMVLRLLQRIHPEEALLAGEVARSLATETGLPPYEYAGKNARRVTPNSYVWSRNLLATRIYRNPVIFLEPYVMNSAIIHERVQAGEYEGSREILGREYRNLYVEYADAVAKGLETHYRNRRQLATARESTP